MPELTTLSPELDAAPAIPIPEAPNRSLRMMALGVVLAVSFTHFFVASAYSFFQATKASERSHSQVAVLDGLLGELISLALLWFVLSVQKRRWVDIGWTPGWTDLLHGVGLIIGSWIAVAAAGAVFQSFFRAWTGHYLQPRSGHGIISGGLSVLTILIVLVNPFFEELIVRGYLMTEVVALGGSRNLAIVVSVLVQTSYHLYQGVLRCVGVAAFFLVLSIYFSRTRKIGPVIVAHFWSDASALIRLAR
jgi:membrane protease YdiL (CAAX protease family)